MILVIIDTHCHIYKSECEDAEDIINECQKNNIILILNGIDKKSNEEVLKLASKYECVYAAIGYDHSVVDKITDDDIFLLEKQLSSKKVVAIGEIGLDYYWKKDNKEKQKQLFRKMLNLAKKYNLPVIVHAREALQDTYDILKEYNLKGSMHCYSGSASMAKDFTKLGFYIGIDGPITYKNNKKQQSVVKEIDEHYILVETDSPYLPPETKRGQKNTPLNLIYIIEKIASIKNISVENAKILTSENAKRLFNMGDL